MLTEHLEDNNLENMKLTEFEYVVLKTERELLIMDMEIVNLRQVSQQCEAKKPEIELSIKGVDQIKHQFIKKAINTLISMQWGGSLNEYILSLNLKWECFIKKNWQGSVLIKYKIGLC